MLTSPRGRIVLGRDERSDEEIALGTIAAQDVPRLAEAFAAMDPWARYPYPPSGLVRYLSKEEPGAPRYAILAGAEIAGVVGLRLDWLRGPYLQFLGILTAHQSKGIGGRVLGWLETEARTRGERNLWVCASDFNRDGIKFYERHGFLPVAHLEGLVQDDRTEVLLRKRISEPHAQT